MYSTGIGLVLEGIARYEEEMSRKPSDGDKRTIKEGANKQPKREGSFSLKGVITAFTNYFKVKSDNIDKDIIDK